MRRFFFDPEGVEPGGVVRLSEAEAHHARDVLRLEREDEVILVDGRGGEFPARIVNLDPGRVDLVIVAALRSESEPPLNLTLGLAVLKSDNMDLVVQKGTELGLTRLVPLYTDRSAVRLDGQRAEKKVLRWREIARQAVKQCRRGRVPDIEPVMNLDDFLAGPGEAELKIMLYEARRGEGSPWEEVMSRQPRPVKATVLVGPEGGFTDREVARAERAGFRPFSLGPRILRAETAAIAVISVFMFALGDLK
ncbi:MAG: 16S rRNA (uracil(1498)-N(3))-methyltransferase [Pseudomonadota bacterium]